MERRDERALLSALQTIATEAKQQTKLLEKIERNTRKTTVQHVMNHPYLEEENRGDRSEPIDTESGPYGTGVSWPYT